MPQDLEKEIKRRAKKNDAFFSEMVVALLKEVVGPIEKKAPKTDAPEEPAEELFS